MTLSILASKRKARGRFPAGAGGAINTVGAYAYNPLDAHTGFVWDADEGYVLTGGEGAYNFGVGAGDPTGVYSVIDDTTGSGRGKVARIDFAASASGVDVNRSFDVLMGAAGPGIGQTFYAYARFWVPLGLDNNENVQRKLLYLQSSQHALPANEMRVVCLTRANGLICMMREGASYTYNSYLGQDGWLTAATFTNGQWNELEVRVTNPTSVGAADGVMEVWLNREKCFGTTTGDWTDPAVSSTPSDWTWGIHKFGQQIQFDALYGVPNPGEYRLLDDLVLSPNRVAA